MLTASSDMIDKSKFFLKRKGAVGKTFFQQSSGVEEEKIEYLWTKDPFYLKQYANLIDASYEDEVNIKDAYKSINDKDLRSHFYIAKEGEKIIAGVRFTVNDPLHRYTLPAEDIGFSFAKLFPELDLSNNLFAQITKFGVISEHRNNIVHYKNAFSEFKKLSDELNIKYIFIVATNDRLRLYNAVAKRLFIQISIKDAGTPGLKNHDHLKMYALAYENKKL